MEKRKPAKPGSARSIREAKEAKETLKQFDPPQVYIKDKVLVLLFKTTASLQSVLSRAHIAYESTSLKGPLKVLFIRLSQGSQYADSVLD